MTVIAMPRPVTRPSSGASHATTTAERALIHAALAECLFLDDNARREYYKDEAWATLSVDSRAFYLERAQMATRLCDLDGLATARHLAAVAIEHVLDEADRDVLIATQDPTLTREAEELVDRLAQEAFGAVLRWLKGQAPKAWMARTGVSAVLDGETEAGERT